MQQCHKINGTWSSFWTKTLVWHGTQVVPCDTRVSCRLVKARVSIQQRWHGGLLLVRVFGKLCCHPPSSPPPPTTPTPPPPPPFSSANFSLRILLLLQILHWISGHFPFSSKQRLARGSCYEASEKCQKCRIELSWTTKVFLLMLPGRKSNPRTRLWNNYHRIDMWLVTFLPQKCHWGKMHSKCKYPKKEQGACTDISMNL